MLTTLDAQYSIRSNLEIVSFATVGSSLNHRDYTDRVMTFRANAKEMGVRVKIYTVKDIEALVPSSEARLFKLRKGAGYWFWKPYVIRDAIKNSQSEYILYVDIDMDIVSDPSNILKSALTKMDLAAFRQNLFLKDFTSRKCLNNFNLNDTDANLWTASIIGARTRSETALYAINLWCEAQQNLRILVDPIFQCKSRHRHDQSIFSCLIANNDIRCSDLGAGFWSTGKETRSEDASVAWVLNGNPLNNEISSVGVKLKVQNFVSNLFHKSQLVVFLFLNLRLWRSVSGR